MKENNNSEFVSADQSEKLLQAYENGKLSRRGFLAALSALTASASVKSQTQQPIQVTSLNHVTFFVKDIPKTVEFYQSLFGLDVLSEQTNGVNLATGSDGSFLGFYGGTEDTETDIHHVCLGLKDFDVDDLVGRLKNVGITAQVRMREDKIPEIYFMDPNGIRIQLQHEAYCGGSGIMGDNCK